MKPLRSLFSFRRRNTHPPTAAVKVVQLTDADCLAKRDAALRDLGMTLREARDQWDDCGCCLVNGNWEDIDPLEQVRSMDFLLGE